MVLVCYGRTSTTDQASGLDAQRERFNALGGDKRLFLEHGSGKSAKDRGKLQEALRFARDGDVFVVTKLDRLGRSLRDVLEIVEQLHADGVGFRCLDQDIDTTKPHGKLMLSMLGACAEYERAMIRERQAEGIRRYQERLKAEGRTAGPDFKCEASDILALRNEGLTIKQICEKTELGRSTVYRALDRANQPSRTRRANVHAG
jgi:DNA invertase Pin-like site-specific DNA recombinase